MTDDDLRDRLDTVFSAHGLDGAAPDLIAALLPLVRAYAADQLDAAADDLTDWHVAGKPVLTGHGARRLRDRAAALRGEP